MTIPSSRAVQQQVDAAHTATEQAEAARDTEQAQVQPARDAATDATNTATADRAEANRLQGEADQAQTNFNNNPTPENQQALEDAQRAAADADARADASETAAAAARANAATQAAEAAAAQQALERAQAQEQALRDQLAAVQSLESAQAELAASQRALQSALAAAASQESIAQQLAALRAEAARAQEHAGKVDEKVNGVIFLTALDWSYKVGRDWRSTILGNQWKTSGSEFKVVLGHSSNLHLAPKLESIYGGKYTLITGLELKTVVGAALTNVAGAKWDTVIGSKNERVMGAKAEHHAGTKTTIGGGDEKEKEPVYKLKYAKWFTDKTEEMWKATNDDIKAASTELKVLEEQDTIATTEEDLKSLVAEYKKIERSFSGDYKVEVATGKVKGGTITINGSSKIGVSSKGNILELTSGHAKFGRGGSIVECKPGQVTLKGTEFKAE